MKKSINNEVTCATTLLQLLGSIDCRLLLTIGSLQTNLKVSVAGLHQREIYLLIYNRL